jgi:hypothetical protein
MPAMRITWPSAACVDTQKENVIVSRLFEPIKPFKHWSSTTKGAVMKCERSLVGATVLRFPPKPRPENWLTLLDRAQALRWEADEAATRGVRLAIHRRQEDDPPEVGDFVSIYRANEVWAAWGVARRGPSLRLWRSANGADIGEFATMQEALAAVSGTACSAA